jgi:putative transcriptional regulator
MAKAATASSILAAVHEAAADLHGAEAMDALTMRRFDVLCLPPVPARSAEDLRRIRQEANVSQAVLAAEMNVGKATVCAWEQDLKTPSGPALTRLDLVERRELATLA